MPLTKREHLRRFRARHRDDEIGERRRAYARWYYQNVTKPKRMAKATEVGGSVNENEHAWVRVAIGGSLFEDVVYVEYRCSRCGLEMRDYGEEVGE